MSDPEHLRPTATRELQPSLPSWIGKVTFQTHDEGEFPSLTASWFSNSFRKLPEHIHPLSLRIGTDRNYLFYEFTAIAEEPPLILADLSTAIVRSITASPGADASVYKVIAAYIANEKDFIEDVKRDPERELSHFDYLQLEAPGIFEATCQLLATPDDAGA